MVIRYGRLSLYDLISHSSGKSHSAYVDVTLSLLEGMVNHSTTFTMAYSSNLIYYLVSLKLDHMDHVTTTTFAKTKVFKVDLTVSEQRIWLYQHVQQSVQLPPIY